RSLCKPLEIEFNNNFFLCKLLRAVTEPTKSTLKITILSCYFTKKPPSKIFKIEKINRQMTCKMMLILSK
ncbi:hypothetical protein, partial [Hoylesella timonensis]|uniref:hypothetical protein n=1 Tax=Hoylesella timonensis TaxID=386414 RepID=UPI001E55805D